MARVRVSLGRLWQRVATRENAWALALFGILTLLVIFTASSAPLWIYQGF